MSARTRIAIVLCGLGAACDGGAAKPAPREGVDFDAIAVVDGRRALEWPDALDTVAAPQPWEKPLRGFSCEKSFGGKRVNGRLRIAFEPRGPRDVVYELAFDTGVAGSPCNHRATLRLVEGHLDDGFLGTAYEYRCRQSPHSRFGVSCGPYLGSDLNITVRGATWGRTVAIRLPPSYAARMTNEDACRLPFVIYDDAGRPTHIDNEQLMFDLDQCQPLG